VRYTNSIDFVYGSDKDGIVKGVKASATYEAASLDPYKFILALLQRVLEMGKQVNLQTHTPATALHEDSVNGGWIVETPRGSIKAKKIVHASNAYVSTLLPEYTKSIIPCRGICTHVAVPEGKSGATLTNLYVIRDTAGVLSYLIPLSGAEGVIVGGSSRLFRPYPQQWYDNVDDSTLIEASSGFFDNFMQRTFNGWENSNAYVKEAWTGVMGYSFDSLPHLGEVPGKSGQYIVAGFNGHGMPVIWLAAKGIAEMIATDRAYEDVKYLPWIGKTTADRIRTAQEGQEGGDIFN
jgi:glycine/D-amino acid oxidase-like deaminating enzyme